MVMTQKVHPVRQMVLDAIAGDYAISAERIQQLRDKSKKEIFILKGVFWIAIGIFNLMVWDPFSTPISDTLRWTIGLGALLVAIVFPVIGIRRHQGFLEQLEDSTQGPKRRKTDDSGRKYMDLVKKQRRFFVHAEFVQLEGENLPD
jgi:hypothetical protein